MAARALCLLLLVSIGAFAQTAAPAITVNGSPVLLTQPVTRIGNEWFVPIVPIAKLLQIDVRIASASSLLSTRRADGTEITYDFRTGEIRNGYVQIGMVKRYQDVQPSASADSLLFPASGIVALFGVSLSEDQQRNILDFSSAASSEAFSPGAPKFNISDVNYRYGLTTNTHKLSQFLDLNGQGIIGGIRTTGRALLSGAAGQGRPGISQASIRADWMSGKALVLGNQNIYAGIDAQNAAAIAGSFERKIRGFQSTTYIGRAVGITEGTLTTSKPKYDTSIAGMSLRRSIHGGELAIGANAFRGATRNGGMIGAAFTAAASTRNQFKIQTLFGDFSGLSSGRRYVKGAAAGLSVSDTFTPVRQLTLSGQYEFYGKNFLTANDEARFNGQQTRAVSATVRPFQFLGLNAGVNEHRSSLGDPRPARTYTYGANVSAWHGAQVGMFRSIQKDPAAPMPRFVMTQYSIMLPAAGRFSGNVMLSELKFQGKTTRNINSVVNLGETRFGHIAVRDQVQLGNTHRIGFEVNRELPTGSTVRIGVDRIFSRTGASGFAPTATIQLPMSHGRTLQISYIGDRQTHFIQLELGGILRRNRGLELDGSGNARIVADSVLTGRMYVDTNANGTFEANVDRTMPNVIVWLDRSTPATTDSHGMYRFDQVSPGAHQIHSDIAAVPADLTFAGPAERMISVAPYRSNTQDLRLVKTGRIAGKVVYTDYSDEDNPIERPLPDARIIATERFDTFSEVDGQFVLGDLPPGQYSFRLDPATIPPHYAAKVPVVSVELKAGDNISGILFQLIVPPKPVIMVSQ